MFKPTRYREEGCHVVDLRDQYAKAWEYIEHLESRLDAKDVRIAELEAGVLDALQKIEAGLASYEQVPIKVRSVALNTDGSVSTMVSVEDST